jgi:hypothetical protein
MIFRERYRIKTMDSFTTKQIEVRSEVYLHVNAENIVALKTFTNGSKVHLCVDITDDESKSKTGVFY